MSHTMKKSADVVAPQYRSDNRRTDGNITLAGICLPKTSRKFVPLQAAHGYKKFGKTPLSFYVNKWAIKRALCRTVIFTVFNPR